MTIPKGENTVCPPYLVCGKGGWAHCGGDGGAGLLELQ